jgi:hypothetical protein
VATAAAWEHLGMVPPAGAMFGESLFSLAEEDGGELFEG